MKGRALKCRACDGALILGGVVFRQHLASKSHLKRAKRLLEEQHVNECAGDASQEEDGEKRQLIKLFCFADEFGKDSDGEAESDGETHEERMQRVEEALQRARAARHAAVATDSDKQRRKKGRGPQERKRPGKRQREELKAKREEEQQKKGRDAPKSNRSAKKKKPA